MVEYYMNKIDYVNKNAISRKVHQLGNKMSPDFIKGLNEAIDNILYFAAELKRISKKVVMDEQDVFEGIIKYTEVELCDLLRDRTLASSEDLISNYIEKYGEDENSKKLWNTYNIIYKKVNNFRLLKEFDTLVEEIKDLEDKATLLPK